MEEDYDFDARYEIDAPKFYDFTRQSPGTADQWFARKRDDPPTPLPEGLTTLDVEMEDGNKRTAANRRATFLSPGGALLNEKMNIQTATAVPKSTPSPIPIHLPVTAQQPNNIVTSWDHIRKPTTAIVAGVQKKMGDAPKQKPKPEQPGSTMNTAQTAWKRSALHSAHGVAPPPRKAPRLDEHATRRPTRKGKTALSTEELQMKQAREEAAREAALRRKQAARLGVVLCQKPNLPPRSTKNLTLPFQFNLQTDKRHGQTHKLPLEGQASWKSLAERVKEFDKTPERFRPKPPGVNAPILPPKQPLTLTVPRGPRLHTSFRSRITKFKPVEENSMEKEEDKREMPGTAKPKRTVPKPFVFQTEARTRGKRPFPGI